MSYADRTHRLAVCGSLTALASVLGLVEATVLPPLPLPGVKLGLANIAVLIALTSLGRANALFVSLSRVVVVGVVTGTLLGPSGALSLGGALAAWATMALLSGAGERFSVVGWAVGGSAAHVAAQFLVAWGISGVLLPPFVMAGSLGSSAITGLATGTVTLALLSRLEAPLTYGSPRTVGVSADGAAAGG